TNGQVAPEQSLLGVGCERCHGPGRAHVAAVPKGSRLSSESDLRMSDLARDRKRVTMELCGQCHTSPLGDDLGNPTVSSNLARLQGPALALSACYQKSDLSCVTCHDPHHDMPVASSAF